jgi:methionyl-tRNA formyltransferase
MMRIAFMGTPEFAVPTLGALLAAGHDVAVVYTQPPRPAGRGMAEQRSPVHERAAQAGLPVSTPASLKHAGEQAKLAGYAVEAAVVVAYGMILPKAVLETPRFGCLNLHASALPRWRGAAPIQRAIMAGDTETAATVMRMDEGLDTGPICLEARLAIGPDMTAGELHDRLAASGAELMVRALADLEARRLECSPQPTEGATYARKIDKGEARLDFRHPAPEVHNRVRGLSPAPGAWLEAEGHRQPERIKVLRSVVVEGSGEPGTVIGLTDGITVACGAGAIRILEVQRPGRRPMSAEEFLRGFALSLGTRLRSPR